MTTRELYDRKQCKVFVRWRQAVVFTICLSVLVFQAEARKRGMDNESILPQIDVIQVKEASDEALRTAAALKREAEALTARVAELEKAVTLLNEEISSVSAAKIEMVETRLALLTEAYKELFAHIRTLENERLVTRRPMEPAPSRAAFTPATEDLLLSSPEYDLYQSGLRLFNGRNYTEAVKVFNDCIAKFPQGRFVDNSWYWIGESYYRLNKMKEAIEAYRNVFTTPHSSKADAAQFKIALSHHKLGANGQARTEFRRLVERYPASEFVERSKKYIAELK
ncbi:MAG: tetratricopeptide repeat protein [Chitinispirillia bacterium]|nr:tetratricopeptide repeat protein [Chitinispirillia bacterium]